MCSVFKNNLAHSTHDNTVLFVAKTGTYDAGMYKLTVSDNGMDVTTQLKVIILELPSPPQNLIVAEHTPTSAVLTWSPAPDQNELPVTYQVFFFVELYNLVFNLKNI